MSEDDINVYIPSTLNPRRFTKHDFNLSQVSSVSQRVTRSLSLRKKCQSLSPRLQTNKVSSVSRIGRSLSLRRKSQSLGPRIKTIKDLRKDKENIPAKDLNKANNLRNSHTSCIDEFSFNFTDRGLSTSVSDFFNFKTNSQHEQPPKSTPELCSVDVQQRRLDLPGFSILCHRGFDIDIASNNSNEHVKGVVISIPTLSESSKSLSHDPVLEEKKNGMDNSNRPEVNRETHKIINKFDKNMDVKLVFSPKKRLSETEKNVIKKNKLTILSENATENSKVLISNTDANQKLSRVIVHPLNYKLVNKPVFHKSKLKNSVKGKSLSGSSVINEKISSNANNSKQKLIDQYIANGSLKLKVSKKTFVTKSVDADIWDTVIVSDDSQDMSQNADFRDAPKVEKLRKIRKTYSKDNEQIPKLAKVNSKRAKGSPKLQEVKNKSADVTRVSSPKGKDGSTSISPGRINDIAHLNLLSKSKTIKPVTPIKNVPNFKIVAGTHFAVDAFSYGDIPNVKHYFLTHFHSDHYLGLKKSFNKILFCSKITADLCVSRLGVNSKCIRLININETMVVEGVEVTAVDANHCPGALMLVFTLPNGKSLLHTGDFRATPIMESYPVFWNKDIHTIYLDTTYCNPRYDFPTQDESLEMALNLLREKKALLEKANKKFSSVLIVCGTYTIGKEKFFEGVSQRVGCSVWACPEKERVLCAVESRDPSSAQPHTCQLHVVPMRDLTYEKLRSYLESLQGAFSEVVAFKPSGWENGKNSTVEKDMITIYGIPYSEHSSFSELVRFVKFLKPKQVVPTVNISGGIKAVQKYFPCPLVSSEQMHCQTRMTDYFSIGCRQQMSAVT